MIRCCITDRTKLPPGVRLIDVIAHNMAQGVEWIQIREKDLSARDLYALVYDVLHLPNPHGTKVIVNTRADVAMAAGAHGVHLTSTAPAPRSLRPSAGFLVGVSCHDVEEVRRAEAEGADYALFGPVFAPLSKTSDLAPRGLDQLALAAAAVRIPVLALGGISWENAQACLGHGAAGVAGISLFQRGV